MGMIQRFWILNATGCVAIWLGTIALFLIDPVHGYATESPKQSFAPVSSWVCCLSGLT
jgi:hypothetical protein